MDRYCAYLRKSRADMELEAKGEGETLTRHRNQLLELAGRMGLGVAQIYEEIVSGETIDSRPVARRLLDEVERGKWAGVLVMEVERLARGDTIDQGVVARAFKLGKTKIITPAKVYDPENEFDEEYFEFGLFMSRREYKAINRRIQRGRIASAREGKFLGSTPPFGYDKTRIEGDKGYTLVPNGEAQAVRLIYTLYAAGAGMGAIALRLDGMGIKARNRGGWSKSTINDILSNPVYTGKLRWSYRVEEEYINGGKLCKRRVTNADPILVDGLHEPIIEPELFDRAQEARRANTHKTTKNGLTLQNPLSGIVYCRKCGRSMTRLGPNKRNKYDTLRCPNRDCDNISAPLFLVEDKILRSLQSRLEAFRVEFDDIPRPESAAARGKAAAGLRREDEKLRAQAANTYDLLEQGVYTAEVFTRRNRELANRRKALAAQISELEDQIAAGTESARTRLGHFPKTQGLAGLYDRAAEPGQRNRILKMLLRRAEYLKETPNGRGSPRGDHFEIHLFPAIPGV